MSTTTGPEALVVGCGAVGLRVARALIGRGFRVYGTTRTASKAAALEASGIVPLVVDVTRPETLGPIDRGFATVVHCVGYDRRSRPTQRQVYVEGLSRALDALAGRFERLVFTSSTGVYGQVDGSWVDEGSATEPASESGRIVLEAEVVVRDVVVQERLVILRLAGLYGPGRLLRAEAVRRGEPIGGDPDHWLNLVHLDDAAAAVVAAIEAELSGRHGVFNVTDGAPLPRRAVYEALARHLVAPPPRFETGGEATGRDLANKRVDGGRARRELGFEPLYPDATEALASCVRVQDQKA
jgi:nucleoside-diphosphate-sugar epimerase